MRLLIIEDNIELADSMKMGMEKYGFSVDVANIGEDGEQLAFVNSYHVIVSSTALLVEIITHHFKFIVATLGHTVLTAYQFAERFLFIANIINAYTSRYFCRAEFNNCHISATSFRISDKSTAEQIPLLTARVS